MTEFKTRTKLIYLVSVTLSRVQCNIYVQNTFSGAFIIERGLRQGDALSCQLFNVALEKVIKCATNGSLYYKSSQVLAYADDLNIIGRSRQAVIANICSSSGWA